MKYRSDVSLGGADLPGRQEQFAAGARIQRLPWSKPIVPDLVKSWKPSLTGVTGTRKTQGGRIRLAAGTSAQRSWSRSKARTLSSTGPLNHPNDRHSSGWSRTELGSPLRDAVC